MSLEPKTVIYAIKKPLPYSCSNSADIFRNDCVTGCSVFSKAQVFSSRLEHIAGAGNKVNNGQVVCIKLYWDFPRHYCFGNFVNH